MGADVEAELGSGGIGPSLDMGCSTVTGRGMLSGGPPAVCVADDGPASADAVDGAKGADVDG